MFFFNKANHQRPVSGTIIAMKRERRIMGVLMVVFVGVVLSRSYFGGPNKAAEEELPKPLTETGEKYALFESEQNPFLKYYSGRGLYFSTLKEGEGKGARCGEMVRLQIIEDPKLVAQEPMPDFAEPSAYDTLLFVACLYQVKAPFDIGVLDMKIGEIRKLYVATDDVELLLRRVPVELEISE